MKALQKNLITAFLLLIFSLSFDVQYAKAQENYIEIEGPSEICQSIGGSEYRVSISLSTEPQPGITSIEWNINNEAEIQSGQGTEIILVNGIHVQERDFTLSVSVTLTDGQVLTNSKIVYLGYPPSPGIISGCNIVYKGATAVSYHNYDTDANGFIWSVPSGASIISGQNTNSILVSFGQSAVSGNITLTKRNYCGNALPSSIFITVNSQLTIGPIFGSRNVCSYTKGEVYSVPYVWGVSTYTWTVPDGAVIVSGQNSRTITVDFSNLTASGTISVTADNTTTENLLVLFGTRLKAGEITGLNAVRPSTNEVTYSIPKLTGWLTAASGYNWEVPNGATIISGENTNSIVVNYSSTATSGIVRVTPISGCGSGIPSNITVTVGDFTTAEGITINPFDASNNYLLFKTNQTNLGIIGSGKKISAGGNPNDLGMSVYGNNSLEFSTNSMKRLIISGSGNVGIGTFPYNKFEINHGTAGNSGLRFTQLNSSSPVMVGNGRFLSVNATGDVILTDAGDLSSAWKVQGNGNTNPSVNFIGTVDAKDFVIRTNNTEKFRITSIGYFGVGTDLPKNKFEINHGTTGNSGLRFTQLNSSSPTVVGNGKFLSLNSTGDVILTDAGTLTSTWNTLGNTGTNPSNNFIGTTDLQDFVVKTNNSEKLRVTSLGNVGIGTILPNNKLEINQGLAGNSGLRFTQLNSSTAASAGNGKFLSVNTNGDVILTDAGNLASTWSLSGNAGTNPDNNFIGTSDTKDLILKTNNIERLRITKYGAIGIGTSNPQHTLQVSGNAFFIVGEDPNAFVIQNGPSGYNALRYDGEQNILFLQENSGNVGIGTTDTKGYKLAVNGRVIAEEVIIKPYALWPDFIFNTNRKLRSLNELEQFIKTNNHLPEIPTEKEVKENGIGVGEMNAKLLQKIEELTLYIIEQNKRIEALESKKTEYK